MSKADDPIAVQALTEIAIIQHLADNMLARLLPEGISTAQYGVLNHLIRLDVQQTVGELAAVMQVAQPTMSSTVEKLRKKHLVETVPDLNDRRVKRVRVTEKGHAERQRALFQIAPLIESVTDQCPPELWQNLFQGLQRVRSVLDEMRGE